MNDSMTERFLGNNGQSGDWTGHFVSATPFMGLSIFFTIVLLKRFAGLSSGQHYCDVYVPEPNTNLLRRCGYFATFFNVIGILFEGFNVCIFYWHWSDGCFFYKFGHMVLYSSYGLIGPILILEANRKLPPDSHRVFLAFSSLCAYILWSAHAYGKHDMTDTQVHLLIAYTCLIQAFTLVFAVVYPKNLVGYVFGYGWFFLLASWLYTAGYNASFARIQTHRVSPYYVAECLATTMLVIWIMSKHKFDHLRNHHYKESNTVDDEEEERSSLAIEAN